MKTKTKAKTSPAKGRKATSAKPRNIWGNAGGQHPPAAKGNAPKIVLATLAIGTTGVVGYFGWQYYKKKKEAKSSNLEDELLKIHPATNPVPIIRDSTKHNTPADTTDYKPPVHTGTKSSSKAGNDDFPLKKGSKGENVKQLQQALMNKYGSSVLPKYGADGDFGSETQNALKKNNLPVTVSESTFNVMTQGGGADPSTVASLGLKLYNAAFAKNLTGVLGLLKNIRNTDDYQQVSASFMLHRLGGVRQTLVNGLLSSFSAESQKQKIHDNKWSLSGFDGKPVVTLEPATVWVNATESIQVPAMMVLGNEVTKRLDYTLFENNKKYFLVKTQSIKYL
jgi:hypothetical protein